MLPIEGILHLHVHSMSLNTRDATYLVYNECLCSYMSVHVLVPLLYTRYGTSQLATAFTLLRAPTSTKVLSLVYNSRITLLSQAVMMAVSNFGTSKLENLLETWWTWKVEEMVSYSSCKWGFAVHIHTCTCNVFRVWYTRAYVFSVTAWWTVFLHCTVITACTQYRAE